MADSVDPADVADESVVEAAEEEAAGGGGPSITDNPLLSTDPNPPISEVESEHSVDTWAAYIIRAGYKATGQAATPAIADALFGSILGVRKHVDLDSGGDSGGDQGADIQVAE